MTMNDNTKATDQGAGAGGDEHEAKAGKMADIARSLAMTHSLVGTMEELDPRDVIFLSCVLVPATVLQAQTIGGAPLEAMMKNYAEQAVSLAASMEAGAKAPPGAKH